jgi:hypothetical protein
MQAGQGSAATKPGNRAQKTCNAISGTVFFLFTFSFISLLLSLSGKI